VPYELHATGTVDVSGGKVTIHFANTGRAAAVFQVRSGTSGAGPWTYTVGAHDALADTWNFGASRQTAYDLSVYGPNGFFRAFEGSLANRDTANVVVRTLYEPARNALALEIHNVGVRLDRLHVLNAYTGEDTAHLVEPGERLTLRISLEASFGWYDVTLRADSDRAFVSASRATSRPATTA
jgi:phospholipase C